MSGDHKYKSLPRGDHEITVRLCYDCDTWHASDDSLLYNEDHKQKWEQSLAHERQQREAAEAERDDYKGRNEAEYYRNEDLSKLLSETAVAGRDEAEMWRARAEALKSYTAKLLALAVEQRRALVYVRNWGNSGMKHYVQPVLKATDLDALLAEAEELGVEVKQTSGAPPDTAT